MSSISGHSSPNVYVQKASVVWHSPPPTAEAACEIVQKEEDIERDEVELGGMSDVAFANAIYTIEEGEDDDPIAGVEARQPIGDEDIESDVAVSVDAYMEVDTAFEPLSSAVRFATGVRGDAGTS